ncbi:flagellar basal body rod protein FlgB [Acetanaerobacterium elongatum]|uniref:Flagellar basal body rod protein FlgB n=1 Tax=Acetanaerobacterium elongatum TaxID=258515 RepID=A0A1G9ZGL6_9FIRM|nr:flagellar basal body rod protein FlgB [Acetanaerobacterium elongatum]SDN20592.1 flagellar basal-body rod protein FlgB [Acetanaerobacterium elongatum]
MSLLGGTSFNLLQQSMDAVWTKQLVTMQNLANVETPGYKAKYVGFETVFKKLIGSNDDKLYPQIQATVKEDTATSMREDGNNVDPEKENLELLRAQIQFDYLQSKMNYRFNSLEHVISEGRK